MKRKLLILSALSMLSVGMAQAQSLKAKVTVKMNEKDATGANYIQESVYAFNSSDVSDFFRMNFCADAYNFENGSESTGQIYMSKDDSHDMPLMFIDRTSCHASIEFVDDEEVHGPSVTVSAASQGWGTICSPFVMAVPDDTDLNVYSPTYDAANSELVLGQKLTAGTIVPKQTPLLVRSSEIPESGSKTFQFNAPLSGAGAALTAPSLKWSLYGYNKGTATNIYTLGISDNKENTVVGFYRYTGTKVPCFKAYLVVNSTGSSKAVTFNMGEEATTSIDGITDVLNVSKIAYNLNGQRVNSDTKGIVIVNGKKLFNK